MAKLEAATAAKAKAEAKLARDAKARAKAKANAEVKTKAAAAAKTKAKAKAAGDLAALAKGLEKNQADLATTKALGPGRAYADTVHANKTLRTAAAGGPTKTCVTDRCANQCDRMGTRSAWCVGQGFTSPVKHYRDSPTGATTTSRAPSPGSSPGRPFKGG